MARKLHGRLEMKLSSLPWQSVLLAPFATIPIVAVSTLGTSDAGIASDLEWGIIYGLLFGVPTAFLAMVVFGLPSYFLLRRFNALRLWSVCAIGFIVPFALFFISFPLGMASATAVAGIAVAVTAYALRPKASL